MLLYCALQHTTAPHNTTTQHHNTRLQHTLTTYAYNTRYNTQINRERENISLLTLTVEDHAVAIRVQPTETSEEDEHGGVDLVVGQGVQQGGCAAGHVSKNDILEAVGGDAVAVPERRGNTHTCVFVSLHRFTHTVYCCILEYNGNGTQHITIQHATSTSTTTTDMNTNWLYS